jgi:uncharacterized membrane protein
MSTLMADLMLASAAVTSLLSAGVYFTFSSFVMRALEQSGSAGADVMRAVNRVILRSAFMPLFFGSTALAVAVIVVGAWRLPHSAGALMIVGGLIYVAGMFGCTVAFNVPLNNRLDRTPQSVWSEYLAVWTRWNHVRTVASVVSGALFCLALVVRG